MPSQLEQQRIERIAEALDLLAVRLDDPPSLQELVCAAGYSQFHFHRVWRACLAKLSPIPSPGYALRLHTAAAA